MWGGGGGGGVDSPDLGWLLTEGSTVILHIYCYLTITSCMINNTLFILLLASDDDVGLINHFKQLLEIRLPRKFIKTFME